MLADAVTDGAAQQFSGGRDLDNETMEDIFGGFRRKGVVNVEMEYMKIQRPKAPECLEYGSLETSYYDMVEKSWRHADMGDRLCFIDVK